MVFPTLYTDYRSVNILQYTGNTEDINMSRIALILLNVCAVTFCAQVDYKTGDWQVFKLNFTGSELSFKTLNIDNITSIDKVTNDTQIELVKDLPNLEYFNLENVDLEILPEFENVPKLKTVSFKINNLIYVKSGSFKDNIETVYLGYNYITVIEPKSFGKNVNFLSLTCNNLKTFSPSWFVDINSLNTLQMDGNLLTKLAPNLFKGFSNLHTISLRYNIISSIGEGALSNRNDFEGVYLGHNQILELKPNIFAPGKKNFLHLYINNNKLTYIAPELLDDLNVRYAVRVNDNPWQCKCWDNLKAWLPDNLTFGRDQDRPACVASLSFVEHCVPYVDKDNIEHYEKNFDPLNEGRNVYCVKEGADKWKYYGPGSQWQNKWS